MTELLRDFWPEIRRAAALVKAVAVHDLAGIHALGPERRGMPDEAGVVVWVDEMNYPRPQAESDEHRLTFALVALVIELARECDISAVDLVAAIDRILSVGPGNM